MTEFHGHLVVLPLNAITAVLAFKRANRMARGAPTFDVDHTVDCRNCGRALVFVLKDQDEEAVIESQWPSTDEFHDGMRGLPANLPCPVSSEEPIRVRFTCKSGRIALGNDLRPYFKGHPGAEGHNYDINTLAGKRKWIEHMATIGYLLGCVGNTHVYFVPREGGLDVVELNEPEWVGSVKSGFRPSRSKSAKAVRADLKASVHHISTELWWFAIVDAVDLPEGATDTFDRPLGFMCLEPGEYEMVYYHRPFGFARTETPDREVWAEIRRVVEG